MQFINLREWSLPRSLVWFCITLVFVLFSIAGMYLPESATQTTVGPYRVSAFPSGLAVYMDTESWLYAISPLNDYLLSDATIRYALLPAEDFTRKNFTNSTERTHALQVYESIGAQLGLRTPWYHFSSGAVDATYTTSHSSNKLKVTRWLTVPQDRKYTETAITFKFNPDDFVYDPTTNNLFTEKEQSELQLFTTTYGVSLNDVANKLRQEVGLGADIPRWRLEGREVIITNLAYPGGLKVVAEPNQIIFINPVNTSVELVTPLATLQPKYVTVPLTIEYGANITAPQ